jgi:HK97 family phage major capsid protein
VTAAVYHPRTWRSVTKLKDSTGLPLAAPKEIAELPKLVTTAMPINETQGTSNDASSIILGNFAHMMIGVRKELHIMKFDGPFIANDQIAFVARLRADVQLSQPAAFNRVRGVRG